MSLTAFPSVSGRFTVRMPSLNCASIAPASTGRGGWKLRQIDHPDGAVPEVAQQLPLDQVHRIPPGNPVAERRSAGLGETAGGKSPVTACIGSARKLRSRNRAVAP
ncbi:MAG TPA: hypothetical protein PLP98_07465, partial [Plasticicumulans sp.]|nr:hypothetical protein [Plasticicumulans sp.]